MGMFYATVEGHLGRDAETKTFGQEGKQLVSFSLGVSVGYGEKKTTIWLKATSFRKYDVTLFNNGALMKGAHVTIVGSIGEDKWIDSQTQVERKALTINVQEMSIHDRPEGGGGQQYQGQQQGGGQPQAWGGQPAPQQGWGAPGPQQNQQAQPPAQGGWGGAPQGAWQGGRQGQQAQRAPQGRGGFEDDIPF